jgi:GTP-binding protein
MSVLTSAKPKIADYPFTTLKPNGIVAYRDFQSFIADIPNYRGAAEGKGLGHYFLRHIEKFNTIILIPVIHQILKENMIFW